MGQLGSGVGIFNGIFQVTSVTQGIDLFIYIVSVLVLLISETQVNPLQINKDELEKNYLFFSSSSNVEGLSIGFSSVSSLPERIILPGIVDAIN